MTLKHMTLESAFTSYAPRPKFDLNSIFSPARRQTTKPKVYCNSIPAVVGPWRGTIRAWHAPDAVGRAAVPSDDAEVDLGPIRRFPARSIPQLRAAMRRERQLGIAGHPSYSVVRHEHLREALKAAARAADTDPWPTQNTKKRLARAVIEQGGVVSRSGKRRPRTVLH